MPESRRHLLAGLVGVAGVFVRKQTRRSAHVCEPRTDGEANPVAGNIAGPGGRGGLRG